jgi:cyclase
LPVIKKRLAAMVTVRRGWAVQSFGYGRYLPLGKPEVLVQNLDRWGADEIFLHCIDRGDAGPDLELLGKVSRLGLATPLIYGGGIRTVEHGVRAVQSGADRVCVDQLLHDDLPTALALGEPLGAQAIIASLPVTATDNGILWHDYRDGSDKPFTAPLLDALRTGALSEALVIDWKHEGMPSGFDIRLAQQFPVPHAPLICFGGVSEPDQLRDILALPNVVACTVGNFLNYREHAIQHLKSRLHSLMLRPAAYDKTVWGDA